LRRVLFSSSNQYLPLGYEPTQYSLSDCAARHTHEMNKQGYSYILSLHAENTEISKTAKNIPINSISYHFYFH